MSTLRLSTPFLGLSLPSGKGLSPDEAPVVFGDQIEALGRDLRMMLDTSDASQGDLLRLLDSGSAEVVTGGTVQAVAGAVSGGRTLSTMVGVCRQSVVSALPTIYSIDQVQGIAWAASAGAVPDVPVKTVVISPGRPVESHLGYPLGSSTMLLDAISPVVIHPGGATDRPLVVDGGGYGVGPALVSGRLVYTFTFTAPAQSAVMYFPLPVPDDLYSWRNDAGGLAGSLWVIASIQLSGRLTWRVTNAAGVSVDGAALSPLSGFGAYALPGATMDGLGVSPGTVSYARLTVSSGPTWAGGQLSEVVKVVPLMHYRYRPSRST